MTFIGILLLLLGLAFGGFGFLIAFRKKYALISNFVDDKHRGKFDDAYARRLGLIELCAGLVTLVLGILTLCIHSKPFALAALLAVALGVPALLLLHRLFSAKKRKKP